MSEVMAFHSIAPGATSVEPDLLRQMVGVGNESLLADITFSGGSLDSARDYLIALGFDLVELPLPSDPSSDVIFGDTLAILGRSCFVDTLERIQDDTESGNELAEALSIVFEEAIAEAADLECDIAIVW